MNNNTKKVYYEQDYDNKNETIINNKKMRILMS